jgi:hypothetical protein
MNQTGPVKRSFDGDDGFAFVVCCICGDRRRVSPEREERMDCQRFTVSIKGLAEWFGLEIGRIVVDECLAQRRN